MSKQDRQGVRKASDIEQKYNLGSIAKQESQGKQQSEKLSQLNQALAQFEVAMIARISEVDRQLSAIKTEVYPVGSVYISLDDAEPSTLFGGTWELMSQGYLLTGLDQESEEAPTEIQFIDKCYIWKRTT